MGELFNMEAQENLHRLFRGISNCDSSAFGELHQLYYPQLVENLRRTASFKSNAEDLAEGALLKIRKAIKQKPDKFLQLENFDAYLQTTAYNHALDWLMRYERIEYREDNPETETYMPGNSAESVDIGLDFQLSEEIEFLNEQLDIVFFKLNKKKNSLHNLKLKYLAAKYIFQDHCSIEDTLPTLFISKYIEGRIDRDVVIAWLSEEGIIRKAAYDRLYLNSKTLMQELYSFTIEEMAGSDEEREVLELYYIDGEKKYEICRNGLDENEIARIITKICANRHEMKILEFYYQFGMEVERKSNKKAGRGFYICEREDLKHISIVQIYRIIKKLSLDGMFTQKTKDIISDFVNSGLRFTPESLCTVLKDNGLWQRLTYQYYYIDSRIQKQILKFLQPSAGVVTKTITENMINNWTSLGRMQEKLMTHLIKHHPRRIPKLKLLFDRTLSGIELKKIIPNTNKLEQDILVDFYSLESTVEEIADGKNIDQIIVKEILKKYENQIVEVLIRIIKKELR